MSKYLKYLKYVIKHKKNVFIECWKEGLYIHAFTHDLSKFKPSEFFPYARFFEGSYPSETTLNNVSCINRKDKIRTKEQAKREFEKAWEYHYKNNKHHPEYWGGKDIPRKYIKQMVCDLKGMSRKFGGTAQEYYLKNYNKWNISKNTRYILEIELDLIHSYNAPICECSMEYYQTIGELISDSEEYFKLHGRISDGAVESNINNLLKPACDKYNLNIYRLVKGIY